MTVRMMDIVVRVRTHLGHPSPDDLRLLDIILKADEVIVDYSVDMKQTNQNWFMEKSEFTIGPDQNDVALQFANYDKAIIAEWIDPLHPNIPGPEIQVVDFQELDRTPVGISPRFYRGYDYSGYEDTQIANAMAFYGMPPNLKVRVNPTPRVASRYKVYYDPIITPTGDPNADVNFPSDFFTLVAAAVSESCLPNCNYDDMKFAQYKVTLEGLKMRAERNFNKWKLKNHHQNVTTSQGYEPDGWDSWR